MNYRILKCKIVCGMMGLSLTACGFHPMYSSGNRGSSSPNIVAALNQVRINTIADREGQELRNELIDQLHINGDPIDPQYNLVISYSETQQDLGLSNDAISTRGQLTFVVVFNLVNIKTGQPESSGSAQSITGYNIQTSEFSTLLSHDDAELRAMREVAENIQTRLAFFFEKKAEEAPKNEAPIPGG